MLYSKKWKSVAAFLCVFMILFYASIAFLPHVHDCVDADCMVCIFIETSRHTMIGLILAATAHQLVNIAFAVLRAHQSAPSGHDATPVTLKVKLLD